MLDEIGGTSSRLTLGSGNKLKLGVFASNLSSGMHPTRLPGRWRATWDENLRLARMADERGLEFIIPLARWRGQGGETNYQDWGFETLTWASALLASTKRIFVFGTVHVPLFHPVVAAKMMITADPRRPRALGSPSSSVRANHRCRCSAFRFRITTTGTS